MNLVYLGSGEFGVPCLDALKASGHNLCLVVTQPANPAGRGRKPQPTPVAQWADDARRGLCRDRERQCAGGGARGSLPAGRT